MMKPATRLRAASVELAPLVLLVLLVWLAGRIVLSVIVERGPPALALRLDPDSSVALRRAAEGELLAKRPENAAALARAGLSNVPFDARMLRVLGLAQAHEGKLAEANDLLTLAGNWSLRDDPAHAWLVQYRLEKNDYRSAFAHADTLARRRTTLRPAIFNLYATAAYADPRSLPPLLELLRVNPPWRDDFFAYLYRTDQGLGLIATLAGPLAREKGGLSDAELSQLYMSLFNKRQIAILKQVKERVELVKSGDDLVNGSFDQPALALPFSWDLPRTPGVVAEMLPESETDRALHVTFSGVADRVIARQLTLLSPGEFTLSGSERLEAGTPPGSFIWEVACIDAESALTSPLEVSRGVGRFSTAFTVPGRGCDAQWVTLVGRADEHAGSASAWFDDLDIAPARMASHGQLPD